MSYNIVLNIKLIPNALFIMSWSSVSLIPQHYSLTLFISA